MLTTTVQQAHKFQCLQLATKVGFQETASIMNHAKAMYEWVITNDSTELKTQSVETPLPPIVDPASRSDFWGGLAQAKQYQDIQESK